MTIRCALYVVRHGETEWNRKGMVQGHTDIPLTPEGEAQAHARAEHFKEIHFSHIVSSDLSRAHHTATILGKERGLDVQKVPALREQSWGSWEGVKFEKIREEFGAGFGAFTGTGPHHVPGVESYFQIAQRVKPALCDIALKHPGNNVLVVTHGGVLKGIVYHLGLSQFYNRHFENLGYLHLESDGTGLHFVNAHGVANH